MSLENVDVFTGGTFEFNVGPEDKSFILHTKLVSRYSPVLSALMCGQMREAAEKTAILRDVDEDTFTRFAEFIYGGDYTVARPLIIVRELETMEERIGNNLQIPTVDRLALPDVKSQPHPECLEPVDAFSLFSKGTARKPKKGTLIRQQLPLFANMPLPLVRHVTFPEIKGSGVELGLMYDYTEVAHHIKMYIFAEQYQVQELKNKVLHKLHRALRDTVFRPHAGELCDLVQHAYQNTADLDSKEEPLRDLLSFYMAWKLEVLMPKKEFQELLMAGGAFVKDLCQKVSRRL